MFRYPCTLSLNEDLLFVISPPWKMFNTSVSAYFYNKTSTKWTQLNAHFPCFVGKASKFTCAYLRDDHSIIVAQDGCVTALNLTSNKWSKFDLQLQRGLVFNIDGDMNTIVFIGSNDTAKSGSVIYTVRDAFRDRHKGDGGADTPIANFDLAPS